MGSRENPRGVVISHRFPWGVFCVPPGYHGKHAITPPRETLRVPVVTHGSDRLPGGSHGYPVNLVESHGDPREREGSREPSRGGKPNQSRETLRDPPSRDPFSSTWIFQKNPCRPMGTHTAPYFPARNPVQSYGVLWLPSRTYAGSRGV